MPSYAIYHHMVITIYLLYVMYCFLLVQPNECTWIGLLSVVIGILLVVSCTPYSSFAASSEQPYSNTLGHGDHCNQIAKRKLAMLAKAVKSKRITKLSNSFVVHFLLWRVFL